MGEGLPTRMSLPEVMGDPCASELRQHAEALLRATASSEKLIRLHPSIAHDLESLRDSVGRCTAAVLSTLAAEAGTPGEGESVSLICGSMGDYRIDRSSGCWIWMRSVTSAGYPVIGRKANGRENVPGKIYWMLQHGPLAENEMVVRTCGSRLCINPEHARITDRREHGAERMRDGSALDWDAVRQIRSTLCVSREGLHERAAELATRLGVSAYSVLEVFRNKVWFDPAYEPGFEITCAAPLCDILFRTTSTVRKYHTQECHAAAVLARSSTRSLQLNEAMSPRSQERRVREEAALRAEAAAAEAEWSEVLADGPRVSVWSVASMDQPIGEGCGELHDVVAAPEGDGDPAAELERTITRDVLSGVTEETIDEMDDSELAEVRAKLAAFDITPSTSRAVG